MLNPNNKQLKKLFECAGVSRWAYNWTLQRQEDNYKQGRKFLSDIDLRKELTKLKKLPEYKWLNKYSNNITKQAIKDACGAYENFFKGHKNRPQFKTKKKSKPSFYHDSFAIKFTSTHVKIEKLINNKRKCKKFNWVKLAEPNRIPYGNNVKYINPRISFDGLNWFISVSFEQEDIKRQLFNDGIGIDLGVKDLAICSDYIIYKNINKTERMKKLEKSLKRKQRLLTKKYIINKQDNKYIKTKNIIKLEKEIKSIYKKIKDIRHNYIHKTTSEIINRKPKFIVIEDLNVIGMMKNRHLSKAIQDQCFHEIRRQLNYKSTWNGIKLIVADRYFPSSKLCSECGEIKRDLKLSDRIYVCNCGNTIDRDLQASINLREYGRKLI